MEYIFLFLFIGDQFNILLNGLTRIEGEWANGAASIAYPLPEKNVFIVSQPDGKYLKMVMIRVTGVTTFDWLAAKFYQNFPKHCGTQSTFNLSCFQGTSANQEQYNVKLTVVRRPAGIFFITKCKISFIKY